MSDKHFKISFLALIVLTLFLLVEGFFYYYSIKLSNFCIETLSFYKNCPGGTLLDNYNIFYEKKTGFNPIIWNENAFIETLQIIFLFISINFFYKILRSKIIYKFQKKLNYIFILYFFFLLYYFFEEISWGQHFFGWISPDFFMEHNNQKETNLHNISNLFDQLPRSLLSIWCGLSFVIVKFPFFYRSNKIYTYLIFPSKQLKKVSLLLIIFLLPDLTADLIGIEFDNQTTIEINKADLYYFFTLNFIRLSEYQELIFTYYICFHSIYLKKYIFGKFSF
mgnify:CR=1 FL=1